MLKKLLSLLFFWGTIGIPFSMAQEKCWSHIYEQQLREQYPGNFGTVESFESWLKSKMGDGYLSQPVKMLLKLSLTLNLLINPRILLLPIHLPKNKKI